MRLIVDEIDADVQDGTIRLLGQADEQQVLSYLNVAKKDIARSEADLARRAETEKVNAESEKKKKQREPLLLQRKRKAEDTLEQRIRAAEAKILKHEEPLVKLQARESSLNEQDKKDLDYHQSTLEKTTKELEEAKAELDFLEDNDDQWRADENAAQDRIDAFREAQAAKTKEQKLKEKEDLEKLKTAAAAAGLKAVFDQEYDGAVSKLLQAGLAAGKKVPQQGRNLDDLILAVHTRTCKEHASGLSGPESMSNGLIIRIREQSSVVVKAAHALGYDVDQADVQSAMTVLIYKVSLSAPSDSGSREEKQEHMARGMAYNPGIGLRDRTHVKWDQDEQDELEKAKNQEAAISVTLNSLLPGDLRRTDLEKRRKEAQETIKRLTKT